MTDLPFSYSYMTLPNRCYAPLQATPVRAPKLMQFNQPLADDLGLGNLDETHATALFSGNSCPQKSLAMAYAGHQFGNFVGSLGDGRALLLGEIETPAGRVDVQLKGSGRTPFSRGGDGRAWLGPVMSEYLMSEAMHALNVPTTRALAMVTTGETVWREDLLPGAILTRVASSHLRVGTFEYFAAREDLEALEQLCEYACARHYPTANGPAELLAAVTQSQAKLIAHWMSLGFIHGVMNTDNCSIAGETIDYGPAAFMESYSPQRRFSQIDQRGRYAYENQPQIALWNLSKLASAFLPLMDDVDQAVEDFTEIINSFTPAYEQQWRALFCAKLGLDDDPDHEELISNLLGYMAKYQLDFTQTFANLGTNPASELAGWLPAWQACAPDLELMQRSNPQVVPRLHLIKKCITAAVMDGDYSLFQQALAAFTTPYAAPEAWLQQPPAPHEHVSHTTCGT